MTPIRSVSLRDALVFFAFLSMSACGDAQIVIGAGGQAGDATTTSTSGDSTAGPGFMTQASSTSGEGGAGGGAPSRFCGDGVISPGEVCDDGNAVSADGCTGTCDAFESGFACPTPGMPCVSTVICGDGNITGAETCDDGNVGANDGCAADCTVEAGWICPAPGERCEAGACGDGIVAGTEDCEDDDMPPASGDGCSDTCHLEPGYKCDLPGAPCELTVCGDGVVEGSEQCDDMNNDLGDGCMPLYCQREPDCTLSPASPCTTSCGDGIMLPNGTEACEDGNTADGDGCSSTCTVESGYQCMTDVIEPASLVLPIVLRDFRIAHPDFENFSGTDHTIVELMLGADGKPVYASAGTTPTTSGKANFDQWYRDVLDVNTTVLQTLTFTQLPTGEYRFDDSTFFPLDGIGWGNEGNGHNFHFTSEVRYWFEYKGGEQLDFTGDDDVWVFVNKRRAIDLGGVHGAQSASITLNAANAVTFDLTVGQVYEIVVFQAERHTTQSNYRLTLSNFANGKSSCHSICGDGIKTPDEVCDDGINDGTYGHCTADCKRGPRCGDGVLQPDDEECDDGVNLSPYGGCAPGCQLGGSCGDGVVDSLFGEACDDGVNDGGYSECAPGCMLGERCGDGVRQGPEACDDGNTNEGDACRNDCSLNIVN